MAQLRPRVVALTVLVIVLAVVGTVFAAERFGGELSDADKIARCPGGLGQVVDDGGLLCATYTHNGEPVTAEEWATIAKRPGIHRVVHGFDHQLFDSAAGATEARRQLAAANTLERCQGGGGAVDSQGNAHCYRFTLNGEPISASEAERLERLRLAGHPGLYALNTNLDQRLFTDRDAFEALARAEAKRFFGHRPEMEATHLRNLGIEP